VLLQMLTLQASNAAVALATTATAAQRRPTAAAAVTAAAPRRAITPRTWTDALLQVLIVRPTNAVPTMMDSTIGLMPLETAAVALKTLLTIFGVSRTRTLRNHDQRTAPFIVRPMGHFGLRLSFKSTLTAAMVSASFL
jgi:hypothetical protein